MDFQRVYTKIFFFFLVLVFTLTNTSATHSLWPTNLQIFGNDGIFRLPSFLTHQNIKKVTRDNNLGPTKSRNSSISYMEKVPDYPEKMVKDLVMKEGERHKDLFGSETQWVRRRLSSKSFTKEFVTSRMRPGEKPDEEQLCPALIQTIYPKQAENKNGKWRYVVNLGGEYTQGVIVETCITTDKCKFHHAFPSTYVSVCEQRYVYKRLLSVTDSGTTVVDEFKMPSCCMCVIKKVVV